MRNLIEWKKKNLHHVPTRCTMRKDPRPRATAPPFPTFEITCETKTEATLESILFSAAISKKIFLKSKNPRIIWEKAHLKCSNLIKRKMVGRQCRACGKQNQVIGQKTKITPELMVSYSYVCMQRNREINVQGDEEIYMCRICKMKMTSEFQRLEELHHQEDGLVSITFKVPTVEAGRCFVCNNEEPTREVNSELQVSIYVALNLYVDIGTKICIIRVNEEKERFIGGPQLEHIASEDQIVRMGSEKVSMWIQRTREESIAFKDESVDIQRYLRGTPDDDFKSLMGVKKNQLVDLLSTLQDYRTPKGSKCREKNLMLLLLKLRHAHSLSFLKALFGYRSKGAVSSAMKIARLALMSYFVPRYLGSRNLTREQMLPHVTPLARTLHLPPGNLNNVVLTIDATYFYLPRSFNYTEMRKTYCTYKHRNLLKMTLCVMPGGYILDALGPYYSDPANTDAQTLKHDLTENVSGLRDFLQPGDVIVYDRGYPDMLDVLEPLGVEGVMPHRLRPRQTQHTTQEANESRIVCKTRWIVETRNGHIKAMSKLLEKPIAAGNVPYVGDYCRILCALINAYRPTIHARDDTEEIGRMLLQRKDQNNELKDYVEQNNLVRATAQWQNMQDVQLQEFPRLTHDDLLTLTLGEYQIRQAASYNTEVEDRAADHIFQISRHDENLLRGKMFSRHRSSKTYHQFIRYAANVNAPGGIRQWYCTCIVGSRVVGMCSHLCAILWYLCIDRYEPDPRRPQPRLRGIGFDAANRDEANPEPNA